MTPKKRLFEMKKELKAIKKLMDKEVRKAEKYERNPRPFDKYGWKDFPSYVIITSDGNMYAIEDETIYFPDFNIKDVVYINKHFFYCYHKKGNKWYNTKPSYTYCDTVSGKLNKMTLEYCKFIKNKFNVTESEYTLY